MAFLLLIIMTPGKPKIKFLLIYFAEVSICQHRPTKVLLNSLMTGLNERICFTRCQFIKTTLLATIKKYRPILFPVDHNLVFLFKNLIKLTIGTSVTRCLDI